MLHTVITFSEKYSKFFVGWYVEAISVTEVTSFFRNSVNITKLYNTV